MQKDYSAKYSSTNGSEKEFDFTPDENTSRLISGLTSPLKMLRNSGRLGIKGAGAFFGIMFSAIGINVVFLIVAIIVTVLNSFDRGLWSLLLVILTGVAFSVIMIRKGYLYAFVKVMEVIYRGVTPLFKKLCTAIVDKTAVQLEKHKGANTFLDKSVNLYAVYNEKLQALPQFSRKALWFVVKRIPFVKFLDSEVIDIIARGEKEKAAQILFAKSDDFINEKVFDANTLTWLWYMMPLNIVVQLTLILLKL